MPKHGRNQVAVTVHCRKDKLIDTHLEEVFQRALINVGYIERSQLPDQSVPNSHGAATEKSEHPKDRTQLKCIQMSDVCLNSVGVCALK